MSNNSNFMTWNPLYLIDYGYPPSPTIIKNGNLTIDGENSNFGIGGTMSFYSGKWYWEICTPTIGNYYIGVITKETFVRQKVQPHNAVGSYGFLADGSKYIQTSNSAVSGFSPSNGDILQLAFDRDNMNLWLGVNGTYVGSGNPATGANPTIAATDFAVSTGELMPFGGMYNPSSTKFIINAGQDSSFVGEKSTGTANAADGNGFGDFYYTPPSGFLAPCSANEPTSTDIDPAETDDDIPIKSFGVVKYTGNGSTQSITGLGFQPDLVWIKDLSSGENHRLTDSSRGVTKALRSDLTNIQITDSGGVTAFGTDGFTVGSHNNYNASTNNLVAWCWRANGGTTATNTSGTATSTVQANTKAGFSICLTDNYTAATGVTIGHGLGKAPAFYIHKTTGDNSSGGASQAFTWHVYHSGLGATKAVFLDTNATAATAIGYWNNTEPTSTVLSLGNLIAGNGQSLVYAWSEIDGFSKFGTYEGNNNNDGTFVYTGFRPRLVFLKAADQAGEWVIYDTTRNIDNPVDSVLNWNSDAAESANDSTRAIDVLSNGFKLRTSNITINNTNTFIFGAWADVPFKYNNTF